MVYTYILCTHIHTRLQKFEEFLYLFVTSIITTIIAPHFLLVPLYSYTFLQATLKAIGSICGIHTLELLSTPLLNSGWNLQHDWIAILLQKILFKEMDKNHAATSGEHGRDNSLTSMEWCSATLSRRETSCLFSALIASRGWWMIPSNDEQHWHTFLN